MKDKNTLKRLRSLYNRLRDCEDNRLTYPNSYVIVKHNEVRDLLDIMEDVMYVDVEK